MLPLVRLVERASALPSDQVSRRLQLLAPGARCSPTAQGRCACPYCTADLQRR
jgi:hypothetical protein